MSSHHRSVDGLMERNHVHVGDERHRMSSDLLPTDVQHVGYRVVGFREVVSVVDRGDR